MTCQKAQGYLARVGSAVAEIQDAKKDRLGPADVPLLLKGVRKIIAVKGSKVVELELTDDTPNDAILTVLLGPSGQVRAPVARLGPTLLVGFQEAAWNTALIK